MRKFVIVYAKTGTSITEVEVEKLSTIEDPSIMFLKAEEWKGKVIKPESLFEKNSDPKGPPVSPVYCWWAFHDSVEAAIDTLKKSAEVGLLKAKAKEASSLGLDEISISEADLMAEIEDILSKVKVVYL